MAETNWEHFLFRVWNKKGDGTELLRELIFGIVRTISDQKCLSSKTVFFPLIPRHGGTMKLPYPWKFSQLGGKCFCNYHCSPQLKSLCEHLCMALQPSLHLSLGQLFSGHSFHASFLFILKLSDEWTPNHSSLASRSITNSFIICFARC